VYRLSTIQRGHCNDDRTQAQLLLDRLLGRSHASHGGGTPLALVTVRAIYAPYSTKRDPFAFSGNEEIIVR